ncbi:hypothetical protein JL721_11039 [Aureococcus anophagefferens]|nr:hypothetical protein JL721_11039 [Aureococcus anophagefferens]
MAPKGRDEAEPQARKSRLGQKRAYIPENPGDGEFPRAASTDSLFGAAATTTRRRRASRSSPWARRAPREVAAVDQTGHQRAARPSGHRSAEGAPEKKKPGKKGKKQPQGFGYGSRASSAPRPAAVPSRPRRPSSQSTRLTAHLPWNKDGPKNYKKPWDGAGKHSTNARNRDERTRAASVVREWWISQRANLDHYHLRVLFYKHEKEASARMGDFKRHQLHLIQTQQRCFTEDAQALKDEVAAQQAEWSEAMERREQAAMEQEVMLSARGLEAEEQRERMKREIEAEKERNLEAARAAAEKRKEEDRLRREEDKAKKEEEELALTRHLAQAKAEAELLAQIDPIRRFLDKDHWFEIIRGLYDAGTIAINLNADGNATECWF